MTGISARMHASKTPPAFFRPKFGRDPQLSPKTRLKMKSTFASRCGWTPYDGTELQGWPVGTIVRGKRVMWEDELLAPGQGQPVRFHQAL